MPLYITQTYAKIGIETSPARLEMRSRWARLELKQNHAQMKMEITHPQIDIDQYEAFASAGLKNNLDLTRSEVEKAKQKILEYIRETAEDGDTLAAIENGGNPIAEIAARDLYTYRDYNIGTIPKVGPKITCIEGEVKIELEKNPDGSLNLVETNYVPSELDFKYTPAQIRIYLLQYASIKFDYISGSKFNAYV
ncbi:MAG TPA: DUF6470 family protein [Acetivibrio clariflavus]|nr:DUF6470 family protein [Acetivibrio clariflavus]